MLGSARARAWSFLMLVLVVVAPAAGGSQGTSDPCSSAIEVVPFYRLPTGTRVFTPTSCDPPLLAPGFDRILVDWVDELPPGQSAVCRPLGSTGTLAYRGLVHELRWNSCEATTSGSGTISTTSFKAVVVVPPAEWPAGGVDGGPVRVDVCIAEACDAVVYHTLVD